MDKNRKGLFRLGFRTQCPSSSHSNSKQKQDAQGFAATAPLRADGQGCPQGCQQGKHARNARNATRTSLVWCAMDSPTTNVYAADSASACTEFWLCECAWWTKVWWFSKLRSEPKELPRNMPSGLVGATLGGLTPQAAPDPRGHGHVR